MAQHEPLAADRRKGVRRHCHQRPTRTQPPDQRYRRETPRQDELLTGKTSSSQRQNLARHQEQPRAIAFNVCLTASRPDPEPRSRSHVFSAGKRQSAGGNVKSVHGHHGRKQIVDGSLPETGRPRTTAHGRFEPSDATAERPEDDQQCEKTDAHANAPRPAGQPLREAEYRAAASQSDHRCGDVESKLCVVWVACYMLVANPFDCGDSNQYHEQPEHGRHGCGDPTSWPSLNGRRFIWQTLGGVRHLRATVALD